jgi:hypothetical protein
MQEVSCLLSRFLDLTSFLLFDRAAGFLPPRPQISDADARSGGQGWPVFGPPL